MSKRISRAAFVKGLAGTGIAVAAGKFVYDWQTAARQIPCRRLGPSMALGHQLRDRAPGKNETISLPGETKKVVIVGGGISGLSAGWWLKKNGFDDFLILEMENAAGGNSSSGKNKISSYPWGAHYVPIANEESVYVKRLFEELGIILSYNDDNVPLYNELYLCHDPQERLYKDGTFQEGLVPQKGLQPEDREEMSRFFGIMSELRKRSGKDGKKAFAIPVDLSSQDDEFVSLDKISMSDWLKQNKFQSPPLLWYVNYCCRDDYGAGADNVSAWAGIHYFAGRRGKAANAENNAVVTWTEGNGFIVKKFVEILKEHIKTGAVVSSIGTSADNVLVNYLVRSDNQMHALQCYRLIFAAPRFLSKYLIRGYEKVGHALSGDLSYAPWMVANISLRALPHSRGEGIAWDNVSYYSKSLGYVVATHQEITTRSGPTVITYYYPMSEIEPDNARAELLKSTDKEWCSRIVMDLEKMHPGIGADIMSIDLWPWGHGMIRPSVGFIWGETRKKMKTARGNIFFAHSDMSGISNFEEAQYHGVEAAKQVLSGVVAS